MVDFVEKLNSESLSLTEEKFESYMRGDVLPEGTNNIYMCDGLRLIHENSSMIRKLKERQEQCLNTATELEQRLVEFRKEYVSQVGKLIFTASSCQIIFTPSSEYHTKLSSSCSEFSLYFFLYANGCLI